MPKGMISSADKRRKKGTTNILFHVKRKLPKKKSRFDSYSEFVRATKKKCVFGERVEQLTCNAFVVAFCILLGGGGLLLLLFVGVFVGGGGVVLSFFLFFSFLEVFSLI